MTTFIVNKRSPVFSSVSDLTVDGRPIVELCARFAGAPSAASNFFVDKTDDPKGVVDARNVEEVPATLDPITTETGRTNFVRAVTDAAMEAKADRNYLVASAYMLSSKLSSPGNPQDAAGRVGPFAMSGEEWRAGLAAAIAAGQTLRPVDLFSPVAQSAVAALLTGKAMKDFAAAENRLPTPVELFFFERVGKDALKLLKLDPDKPCSGAFDPAPAAGSYGASIAVKKSGEVIKAVKDGLVMGFTEARAEIGRLPPHLRFFSDEDAAPWLTVARLLKADNLQASPDKLAGQLMSVIGAMTATETRSAVFVGFCLTFCGVKEAKDKVPAAGVGLPDTWKAWAGGAGNPVPAGAIVVTKPEGGKSSVGILAATPTGDTFQVYLCSEDGPVNVAIKAIARDKIDVLRWFDIAGAGDPASAMLGSLSRKFESGSGGPGTVSSGNGDAGGVSYGTYQLTSKDGGSVTEFVDQLPAALKGRFAGLVAGTPAFSTVWQAIAAEDAAGFGKLQHDYIKAKYYDVLVASVKAATGFDGNGRSAALQNCLWSTAVQHGAAGGAAIVNAVIAALQAAGAPLANIKAFDEQALQAIYAERGRANGSTLVHFSNNSASVQQSVANRFVRELADALKMLADA
jgi:hypothetical protein